MEVIINGKTHVIETEIVHEQSEAYYEALAKEDWFKVRMLYIRPTVRSWDSIQREIDILRFNALYESESNRIENASEFELKMDIENDYRPIRDFKLHQDER